MKTYFWAVVGLAVVVGNYYGFKLSFEGMTYNSDLTFFGGLVGVVLLGITDGLLLKKFMERGEKK